MSRLVLLCILPLLLAGCARPQGGGDLPQAADLVSGTWVAQSATFRVRQSVLFEFRGARIPMSGLMEVDLEQKTGRLVGMNELGVKFFDLSILPEGHREHFLLPDLAAVPGLPAAVAEAVRRIFLTPQPAPTDLVRRARNGWRLERTDAEGREYSFLLGGPQPLLLEKSAIGRDQSWRVRYDDYRQAGELWLPGRAILQDRRAGYRLTLWLEEMKRTEP